MSSLPRIPTTQAEIDAARALHRVTCDYLKALVALQASFPTHESRVTDESTGKEVFEDMIRMVKEYGEFNQFVYGRLAALKETISERYRSCNFENMPRECILGVLYDKAPAFKEASRSDHATIAEFMETHEPALVEARGRLQTASTDRMALQTKEYERHWRERAAISAAKAAATRKRNKAIRELEQSGATPTAEQIVQHMQAARAVAASAASTSRKAKTARAMKKVGRGATKGSSSADRP